MECERHRSRELGEGFEWVGKLLEKTERRVELSVYEAVSTEKAKWEAQEEWLVEQLTETKEQLKSLQTETTKRQLESERLSAPSRAEC